MTGDDAVRRVGDLVRELFPLGRGTRVELTGRESSGSSPEDGISVLVDMIVYEADGFSIEDIKEGEVCLVPAALLADPDRAEVYLRGWAAAVEEVLKTTTFENLAELSPHDFVSPEVHFYVPSGATVARARDVQLRALDFGRLPRLETIPRAPSTAMDADAFWGLIEEARASMPGDVVSGLHALLAQRSAEEIESFQGWLDAYFHAASRRELWAAASYIQRGCSDDGFDYFRGWLIAEGRSVFEAAMRDPGTLADHRWPSADQAWPRMSEERMRSVGHRAFELAVGRSIAPGSALPVPPEHESWPADRIADYGWSNDETVALFPALATRWPRPSA
ncbi:MAG: DUF4240 domain-containing protein [Myxococcales bacterium]|nr:DUF4240 domain-containing protein [Myxococcales bacterium]